MKIVKTALVLSAGGMFGAYQAGAWKALAGIFRPDLVIGASVGALNGWAIAGGADPEELASAWMDPSTAGLIRLRICWLPWRGLCDAGPLAAKARELFSAYSPRVPFAGILVQIPRLRLHLIHSADMGWEHLGAMCAVPGLFPPVRLQGKLYVDGGLLSVLPLWAAARLGATRVVAVDALPKMPSIWLRSLVGMVRRLAPAPPSTAGLEVLRIAPPGALGSVTDALRWNAASVRRWIEQGERDARRIVSQSRCFTGGFV